jgi:hypothetical protein
MPRFPGAAQHGAKRSDALQTRDRCIRRVCDDPGSAVHRFALHRVRETSLENGVRRRNAEINLPHLLVLFQLGRGAFQRDASGLQHIGIVGDAER